MLQDIDARTSTQEHVLIASSGINFVDIAGAEMLVQECRRRKRMGGGMYFYRLKAEPLRLLQRGGYLDEVGEENIFR